MTSQDAKMIEGVKINDTSKHVYLSTTIISDNSLAFPSPVMEEVADAQGHNLDQARTKPAGTLGMLEETPASLKKALMLESGKIRSYLYNFSTGMSTCNY